MTEPRKIRRLKKLAASEVSLVNRGAIRRPFLVIKNQEGLAMADATSPVVPHLSGEHEAKFAAIAKRFGEVAKAGETGGDDDDIAESEGLDERAMAALKAVYRILLPFKGQIPEDAVDDVLAELDLDDTGDDAQNDEANGDDDDDADDATQDPQPEDDQAMAKKFDPEDLKKAADWSPSQAAGTTDDDHNKAVMAAKNAYAKCIGKGADDEDDDEMDDDKEVSKSAVAKAALPIAPEHAEMIAKAEGRAATLEARIAKMEDESALLGYENSIRAHCTVLGKDVAEQARIVKSAYAADKTAGDAYVALLADSARMSQQTGVFKTVGVSNNAQFGGNSVPNEQGSPRQQLDALINACVQKGDANDESAAWNTVLKTKRGQELYNQLHGGRN